MLLYPTGPDPFLLLLLALLFDLMFADMEPVFRFLPHPVAIAGSVVSWLDRRLNRPERSDRTRRARGVLVLALMIGAAAPAGWAVTAWLRLWNFGWAGEALVVAVLLAQRSLFEHVAKIAAALAKEGLAAGREAVAHIVGRDPLSLDEFAVARAAIESLFENFSDGVVAPALWYLCFGLPGIFVYKTVNTMDSMIGHRSPRYLHFGWAAARFDDLLNLVPARLSGVLIALAAFALPGTHGFAAFRTLLKDAGKHRSPNAGWPEAAAAGALGLALAGPRRYGNALVQDPWLGDGRARATPGDIARGLRLYLAAGALFAALLAGGAAARSAFR
jgi:adenosylcobinamide-phosphate synthase